MNKFFIGNIQAQNSNSLAATSLALILTFLRDFRQNNLPNLTLTT